jgi:acetolactate decarboxylase
MGESGRDSKIYLCAPINALIEGLVKQSIPLSRIRERGDFGLGTFDNLDGELVLLDGCCYQSTSDGHVHEVSEESTTPFAAVTFFTPVSHDDLADELSYEAFVAWLGDLLPSPNLVYALRIEGEFAEVKVRSITRQETPRPLVEAAREQPVFTFRDVRGTLAGFFTPHFLESLSAPGFHLHFISESRREGGHLLSCRPRRIRAGVQFIFSVELGLPVSLGYLTCAFERDAHAELDEAEKESGQSPASGPA